MDILLSTLGVAPMLLCLSFHQASGDEPLDTDSEERIVVVSCLGRDVLKILEDKFTAREPKVEIVHAVNDGVVQSRMKSFAPSERPHILYGTSTVVLSVLADWGMLEPYEPEWGEEIPVGLSDRDRRWYGLFGDPITVVYNREYFAGDQDLIDLLPVGWEDLGSSRFREQLILENPTSFNATGYFLASLIDRAEQLHDDRNAGFDLLRRIDRNVLRVYGDRNHLKNHLFSGERGSITVTSISEYERYVAEDMPADLILPAEGFFLYPRGIALVKGAPEAAREVYDFLTGREILERLNRERGAYSLVVESTYDFSVWPGDRHSFDFFPTNHDSVLRNISAWVGEYQSLIRGKAGEKTKRIDDAVNTVMMFLIPVVLVLIILSSRVPRRRKKP